MDIRDPFQPKMPQGCDSECELLILRVPWFQHGLLLTLTESIDSLQTPVFFCAPSPNSPGKNKHQLSSYK